MSCITSRSTLLRRVAATLLLVAPLAGCGGGEFAESLARLLAARFVPAPASVPRGGMRTVDFEVTCDKAALDTPFGRLGLRIRLDPQHVLPVGFSAMLPNAGPADNEGFVLVPCTGAHADPQLRIAHVAVQVQVAANAAAGAATLTGYVEVEPLLQGQPSKDSTLADLAITVSASESPTSPG
jgi:hypothetical protein